MSEQNEIPSDLRFDPTPKKVGDVVIPTQLSKLRSLAARLGLDLETECDKFFSTRSHELSVGAADALIKRFERLKAQRGAAA